MRTSTVREMTVMYIEQETRGRSPYQLTARNTGRYVKKRKEVP